MTINQIKWLIIIIVSVWIVSHPNTKALYKGLHASFVEAPLEEAKQDVRKELEEQARKREEKRAREINKYLEEAGG